MALTQSPTPVMPMASPLDIVEWFKGVEVPDPITFVLGPQWLARPNLYPRQATLLKVIFLRDDLFTPYDREVIAEWMENYQNSKGEGDEIGDNGTPPDLYERIAWLKSRGYKWFKEVMLALGRRAGKGYVSALAMAYVLWNYMGKGDPQDFYGIDRDKELVALIFAGKRDQAIANLWGDLYNVITTAPCFAKYISRAQGQSLSVFAPHDFVRIADMEARGIRSTRDPATFQILPKESTGLAGRGPASFSQGYDEMAHVVKATAKADAKDVYSSASPSLDQFGKDGFLVAPSSTWEMIGQFYELCEQAQANENGQPLYPTKLLLQLESWEIYYDWERAGYLPALPEGFTGDLGEYTGAEGPPLYFQSLRGAIQTYDEEMQQIEAANPDTFAVERRSKWASVLDAYLDASKVDQVFQPWMDRPEVYGPAHLTMQRQGLLVTTYKAHGDPAEVNCRFGFAVAHEELDADGVAHAVFDLIHYWDPAEFPEHTIDYDEVMDWIWDNVVLKFHPEELTFDQFNNIATIQRLQKKVRASHLPKRVNVFEKTATNALNWTRFETFKAAINMGLVHAPPHEEAKKELTFLQRGNGNKVDHPTAGPVQTKDIADCLVEAVHTLLGEQMNNFLNKDLRNFRPGGGLPGGVDPLARMSSENDPTISALANFGRRSSRRRMAG